MHVPAGMVPVEVTVTTPFGVGMDLPYGLDLAGILAASVRATASASGEPLPDLDVDEPDDLNLPLARCITPTDPDQWHWAATCAIVPDDTECQTTRVTRQFDQNITTHLDKPLGWFVQQTRGPYRALHTSRIVHLAGTVRWRAVADPDAAAALLAPVRSLGRGRGSGDGLLTTTGVTRDGALTAWTITTPDRDVDPWQWVHVDDTKLVRPVPTECAEHTGVGWVPGRYAIRPPSSHPERLMTLAMTDASDPNAWATW